MSLYILKYLLPSGCWFMSSLVINVLRSIQKGKEIYVRSTTDFSTGLLTVFPHASHKRPKLVLFFFYFCYSYIKKKKQTQPSPVWYMHFWLLHKKPQKKQKTKNNQQTKLFLVNKVKIQCDLYVHINVFLPQHLIDI